VIDYKEMLEFLEELKNKLHKDNIPLIFVYNETRKNGWSDEDVRNCLKFLNKQGKIRVFNFSIYL
jgi:hypothetical protein